MLPARPPTPPAQGGFTLVEVVIGLAVASLLAMVAVPSFSEMMGRMRLEGLMSSLTSDLQYTRSEAVRRQQDVRLVTDAAGAGYVIEAVPASGAAIELKSVSLSTGTSLSAGITIRYNPLRAFATTSGAITGRASGTTAQLRTVISNTGVVQVCSPDGTLKGYTAC